MGTIEAQSGGESGLESGVFWLVATPIGNLGDWSPRARDTLQGAALVLAEDTRSLAKLLAAAALPLAAPVLSAHDHNEAERCRVVLEVLASGRSVALVSDAGMPVVSDPGFVLVREVLTAGHPVRVVPGPSAVTTALAASGLPPDRFRFVGFLPATGARREAALRECLAAHETQVLFESSHRIGLLAGQLATLAPDRRVSVQRELTKRHEEHVLAPARELPAWLAAEPHRQRGEFVVVVEGAPARVEADALPVEAERLIDALGGQVPARVLARAIGVAFGLRPNRVAKRLMDRNDRA